MRLIYKIGIGIVVILFIVVLYISSLPYNAQIFNPCYKKTMKLYDINTCNRWSGNCYADKTIGCVIETIDNADKLYLPEKDSYIWWQN